MDNKDFGTLTEVEREDRIKAALERLKKGIVTRARRKGHINHDDLPPLLHKMRLFGRAVAKNLNIRATVQLTPDEVAALVESLDGKAASKGVTVEGDIVSLGLEWEE